LKFSKNQGGGGKNSSDLINNFWNLEKIVREVPVYRFPRGLCPTFTLPVKTQVITVSRIT
jgi:hypothetical protein